MEKNIYEIKNNLSEFSYLKLKETVYKAQESLLTLETNISNLSELANILKADSRKNVQGLGLRIQKNLELRIKEIERVRNMYAFDKSYIETGFVCGVDEVGRGPLAGPIVAGAVILSLDYKSDKGLLLGIKDSKKLSSKLREELSEIIKAKALAYSVSQLENTTIDSKGIAFCNNEIFRMAVASLTHEPTLVLSDGYPIKNIKFRNEFVVKGDAKSASIACASIIAKVYRDNLMKDYSEQYPEYDFEENMGYGTKNHIEALKDYGPCKIHRRCFLNNIL